MGQGSLSRNGKGILIQKERRENNSKKCIRNHTINSPPKLPIINVNQCIYVYIYSLKLNFKQNFKPNFPFGLTLLPPRSIDHLTKTPTIGMRIPLFRCLSGLSIRLPKPYKVLLLPSVITEVEGKSPLLKSSCTSSTGPRSPLAGTDLNASFLRTRFHSARKHHASF